MKLNSENPLAVEIQQEMAATYFAACSKMVDSLEALRAFDRKAAYSLSPEQTRRRSELVEDTAERVYFVIIQREAMEFSADPAFFERYEVPNEVRTKLGPKHRK